MASPRHRQPQYLSLPFIIRTLQWSIDEAVELRAGVDEERGGCVEQVRQLAIYSPLREHIPIAAMAKNGMAESHT